MGLSRKSNPQIPKILIQLKCTKLEAKVGRQANLADAGEDRTDFLPDQIDTGPKARAKPRVPRTPPPSAWHKKWESQKFRRSRYRDGCYDCVSRRALRIQRDLGEEPAM